MVDCYKGILKSGGEIVSSTRGWHGRRWSNCPMGAGAERSPSTFGDQTNASHFSADAFSFREP